MEDAPPPTSPDAPPDAAPPPQKSFLVQRFGRLAFGRHTLIGYSVAGEESVVQCPELNVCFDVGRAPQFALTSDLLCLTHGHMDHLAGIAYYASQRYFQGMKAGTILLPAELERPVDDLLRSWRGVERQMTPYALVPMRPGDYHEVRRDFGIRCFATHHGGPSLGYSLVDVREKLKPEFLELSGPEIVKLKRAGTEIQYRLEVPLIAYLGDTTAGRVFEHPDVVNADILVTECTFYEGDHRKRAKAGRHLHADQFAEILPTLKNRHIVITHVSRRTGVARAKRKLRKLVGDEQMRRITFLMDFSDSTEGGDVEGTIQPYGDGEG